jgi:hypothetical protein
VLREFGILEQVATAVGNDGIGVAVNLEDTQRLRVTARCGFERARAGDTDDAADELRRGAGQAMCHEAAVGNTADEDSLAIDGMPLQCLYEERTQRRDVIDRWACEVAATGPGIPEAAPLRVHGAIRGEPCNAVAFSKARPIRALDVLA